VTILLLLLFALPVSAQADRPAAPQAQTVAAASADGWDVRSIGRGALIGAGCGALIVLFAWFKRRGSK
jgi:hypothetical protein